jgi:hypothetical protein
VRVAALYDVDGGDPDLDDLVVGERLLRPADPEEVAAFFERARLSAR